LCNRAINLNKRLVRRVFSYSSFIVYNLPSSGLYPSYSRASDYSTYSKPNMTFMTFKITQNIQRAGNELECLHVKVVSSKSDIYAGNPKGMKF
jgi:hypothetical protein